MGLYPFRTGQTDISVRVRSLEGTGIVVERAMWWPGQGDSWREAHNSLGRHVDGIALDRRGG